jgi:hypothetical protein
MPPQPLGWSIRISPAFELAFDSCAASTAVERGTFDFDSLAHLLGPRDGADDGGDDG